jgi:hypothetical protein
MNLRRCALLFALLTLSGCGASLRERDQASSPSVQALQAGRFDEASKKAAEVIDRDKENPRANLVDAITRYHKVVHDLTTDLPTLAIAAMATRGFNERFLRISLETAEAELAAVDADLARAAKSADVSLELCVACWEVDWNRNGEVDERDRHLLEVEYDSAGKSIPEGDPRRRPTFRFDQADVLWARAFTSFQRAAIDIVLGYGYSNLDQVLPKLMRRGGEGTLRLKLEHPERIEKARALILAGLDLTDAAREAALRETDDDREWVPSPTQKSHPLPLPVDAALYETWKSVVGDLRRIVRREEGLPVADLAQLGDHKWKNPPRGFLDLGGMLQHPKDLVIDFGDAKRVGDEAAQADAVLSDVFGEYYSKSMKPSPLIGRLERMRKEVEHGTESMERKLRYLFWLN